MSNKISFDAFAGAQDVTPALKSALEAIADGVSRQAFVPEDQDELLAYFGREVDSFLSGPEAAEWKALSHQQQEDLLWEFGKDIA